MTASLRFARRHWRRLLTLALAIGILLPCVATWWAASEIATPPRRPLMDYHRKELSELPLHGVSVEHFIASDGTPCLVCIPVPSGRPGERGVVIRDQLTRRGVTLEPPGTIVGNLVLNHGRKGRKEDYLPIAERLCAVGFRCIIPDMPAHGENPAPFATYGVSESRIPALVLEEASRKYSFAKEPAGLLGLSMGGSVSVHAAALPGAPWKTLVVISSFDRFLSAVEGQARGYVGSTIGRTWASSTGLAYQVKTGYQITAINPCLKAPAIHIPVMVAHGSRDGVAPLACDRRLFDSFTGAPVKKWVEVPGATHDNVLITSYPIYSEIAEWMLRHVPEGGATAKQ